MTSRQKPTASNHAGTLPANDRALALIQQEAWQELLDKDDRTSPEEYPDMVLITREELDTFLGQACLRGRAVGQQETRRITAPVLPDQSLGPKEMRALLERIEAPGLQHLPYELARLNGALDGLIGHENEAWPPPYTTDVAYLQGMATRLGLNSAALSRATLDDDSGRLVSLTYAALMLRALLGNSDPDDGVGRDPTSTHSASDKHVLNPSQEEG